MFSIDWILTVCVCVCVCVCMLSHSVMSDSETAWTLSCQSPLSVEFSSQECISYSRGFSWPRDWTQVSRLLPCKADSLPLHPIGSQLLYISSVQSLSHVQLFVTAWTAAHHASLLHMPLEAINKELSRHESNSQQAIIMELTSEKELQ